MKPESSFRDSPSYIPSKIEQKWQDYWEKNDFYKPDDSLLPNGQFRMVLPPPNVTGSLHIGHAFMCAVEDTVVRYQRMLGKCVQWLPGADHAGIATQTIVEKQQFILTGKKRTDFSRDEFLSKIWEWTNLHMDKIKNQLTKIGCSLDWDGFVFTMEERLQEAVKESFVRLYEKDLIYRGERMINHSCALNSAISEIEVDTENIEKTTMLKVPGYKEKVQFGALTYFIYPFVDSVYENEEISDNNKGIQVATTRPETILGDVAVAVNSKDNRYKHLIGKKLKHPLLSNKEIPIISDDTAVDMEFGTGAVKITPYHDLNDFETAVRNNLPIYESKVINEKGLMFNLEGTEYEGIPRYDCRKLVLERLEERGYLVKQESHKMSIRKCSRSGDIIEPMLKKQWFVKCKGLANRVLKALDEKEVIVRPSPIGENTLRSWLNNIEDWCVSRQLWWGHRIPAYYSKNNPDHVTVARTKEEAAKILNEELDDIEQDNDVLDTWYSSGLFPFSPYGWPDKREEGQYWSEMLETGNDIIFFWVARMLMLSFELTGKAPFKEVLLHGIIRDKTGAKMSKSKGNVLCPLTIIKGISLESLLVDIDNLILDKPEKENAKKQKKKDFPKGVEECGADALRAGLLSYMTNEDLKGINLDVNKVISFKHFCNKLWNLTKFFTFYFDQNKDTCFEGVTIVSVLEKACSDELTPCRWILGKLNELIQNSTHQLDVHNFSEFVYGVYDFSKKNLCDVFLEIVKPILNSNDKEAKEIVLQTLWLCIDRVVKVTHPLMPHITEELWQSIPPHKDGRKSLIVEKYPSFVNLSPEQNNGLEEDYLAIDTINLLVNKYRSFANFTGFDYKQQNETIVSVLFKSNEVTKKEYIVSKSDQLVKVTKCWKLLEGDLNDLEVKSNIEIFSNKRLSIFIEMDKSKLKDKDIGAIKKKLEKTLKFKKRVSDKIKAKGFDKRPKEVREKEQDNLNKLCEEEELFGDLINYMTK
eukprot:GAHX01001464.1.p1 GENE.GAHX01001464.1~~GAHX01001464.1.p1  ORF type:complete len:982 (-),score=232.97 GAHX01001464.1:137-3082(-)